MKFSDEEILKAIQDGASEKPLTFLYETVQPKIKAWILQNNGDEEEAQDIFQDAVIAFYRYVTTGQFKQEYSIAGFIFQVSKNMWINRVKQKNKLTGDIEQHVNLRTEETDFDVQTITQDRAEIIQEILSRLGERCKELLTYSIFHNMSMKDISKKMNFSNANTAKTKNYKCKQRLIKLVKDNEYFRTSLYT
ncbi:MAG: sigma-70 family RNA polymerase sigma factor [Flavobacteriales bacterium]|nr:sigma-70 family RNA polymerase sigma factor [Flavobacteriales bacterium]